MRESGCDVPEWMLAMGKAPYGQRARMPLGRGGEVGLTRSVHEWRRRDVPQEEAAEETGEAADRARQDQHHAGVRPEKDQAQAVRAGEQRAGVGG